MTNRLTINDAVREILKEPAPVLFPDTCALLDIIRLPQRAKDATTLNHILTAAIEVLSMTRQSPKKNWIVVSPPIEGEWLENSIKVVEELKNHIKRLDADIGRIHKAAINQGIILNSPEVYSSSALENSLLTLSSDLLNSGIILLEDSNCKNDSHSRTILKIAPAKNGSSYKDCLVVEHALAVCRELKSNRFSDNCVFLTSNTSDFFESSTTLQPPLDNDFVSANLKFASTWNWAKRELGI